MGGAGCVNRRRRGAPTRFEVSIFYILSTFANELCFFPSRVGVDAGGMGTPSGLSLLRRYSTDEVRHESENAVYSPGSIFTLENLAGGAGEFILMRVVWAIRRMTSCFVHRVPYLESNFAAVQRGSRVHRAERRDVRDVTYRDDDPG